MYIKKLRLRHFKNHAEADFEFTSGINCFYGKNGVGKTNVLDAIHFLSSGRSYFSRLDANSIRFDQDFANIEASVEVQGEDVSLFLALQIGGKKVIRKDEVMVKRIADYVGFMPVVMVTPGDILMLTGSGEERRRFMDKTIGFSSAEYLRKLILHNKLIDSRNELFKQFYANGRQDMIALESIDHQLIPLMDYIHDKRKQFLHDIGTSLQETYDELVGSNEELKVSYQSPLENLSAAELLKNYVQNDLFAQRTTQGVHKDDLIVEINGAPVRKFASQGQIKSATITLNLASYRYLANQIESEPILLLDDIFEKIDDNRAERLLGLISNSDYGQIFITDTSLERLKDKLNPLSTEKKFFNIEQR